MPREKYTKERLEAAVSVSRTLAEVMRHLGLTSYSGSQHTHIKNRLAAFGIDTTHIVFGQSWARGRTSPTKKKPQEILRRSQSGRRGQTYQLRRALLESGVDHRCAECAGKPEWRGKPLVLQVDHIDGDRQNDDILNLRFLCPNCHSQTGTYGKRSKSRV